MRHEGRNNVGAGSDVIPTQVPKSGETGLSFATNVDKSGDRRTSFRRRKPAWGLAIPHIWPNDTTTPLRGVERVAFSTWRYGGVFCDVNQFGCAPAQKGHE